MRSGSWLITVWALAALLLGAQCGGEPSTTTAAKGEARPAPKSVPIDTERVSTTPATALGNLDAAIEELRRLIEARDGDAALERRLVGQLLHRASYLGSYDDFVEVERLTQADIDAHPEDEAAWLSRASFLGAVHRFEEAREALDRAAALGADVGGVERRRWVIELASGDDPDALVEQAAARRERTANFQSIADHANALAAAGRFEEADAAYVEALASYRDTGPFLMAWTAFQRGVMWAERADRGDLAIPLYREAVRRVPRYVVAHVHLAELEWEEGEVGAATARLAALADEVGDPEPGGLLAELLAESDPEESERLIAQSRARYDVLLERHRAAFLDHGSEFFSGPGGDPARGLALARENLAHRPTARAYKVAVEAAVANDDVALACELAAEGEALRARHPVLDHVIAETCPR